MSDQLNGRTAIPPADPNAGYSAAIDAALAQLRRTVSSARDNGVDISPEQDREARSILTP